MNRTTNLNRLNDNGMRISNPDIKQRRRKYLLMAALMLAGTLTAGAQNYVFYNSSVGYLNNNNNALGVKNSFDPSCVWIASGTLGETARTIESYTVNGRYLNSSAGNGNAASLGTTSSNVWLNNNDMLALCLLFEL